MLAARITHGTWILVSDGRKALFMRQDGDESQPSFSVQHVMEAGDNPRNADQGSDRPTLSRPASGAGGTAVGQADWHDLAERDFARATVEGLERIARDSAIDRLAVVAPPRTLAVLRDAMSPALREATVAELAKDYVRHPVPEIERLLTSG